MENTRSSTHVIVRKQGGFTLAEVMITIVIMGILFAIATTTWQNLIESRRVDSASNQLLVDLRSAHASASNQLATWRVVLNPDRRAETAGADYSLVKLDPAGNPIASSTISRTFAGNVALNSPTLVALGGTRAVDFAPNGSASAVGTLDLGAAATDGCPSGTPTTGPRVRVTVDNAPMHCITFNPATSRIKVD